ncbi:MAG: sulfatase-like hydrolase/transferase [Lentisphaerae bacterium]|nr:sulfatase-like hydrolase/transferase [Victivallaceae bacterium]MDD3703240.1 sulfatase-like hydrolase/transferase [Victivallaceae bacterium]NLK84338.1 sulfatase-like hydrolase/transferase [Lentisphaerota bacterium]
MNKQPNILFIMTDQQRFDTIARLGNSRIYTPNFDRLVERGLAFSNAYSPCPVCIPARYVIRTGCEPKTTGVFKNGKAIQCPGVPDNVGERCGGYLPEKMKSLGYRTFGIGKFHTIPWDETLGYDVHLHSEELYSDIDQRKRDAYASFIKKMYPEFSHIEQLHGERTDMYYMPQMSALPAEITVEGWAADRAVEQINSRDKRPYFGFVSFIGPHPPFAPPVPFNRMYDPDKMSNPLKGDIETDHMDEQIPYMNHSIWAEDINDSHARVLKARYYGEISYIDQCLGKILDAVEARDDAANTLICFFSDHGDHLGDHYAWQKESFFDASCKIPLLISWPARIIAKGQIRSEIVSLTDLFGLATGASGQIEKRDGIDLLGIIDGNSCPREYLCGMHAIPGTCHFKIMIRNQRWKYIFMANGGLEQLFDMDNDPSELHNIAAIKPVITDEMRTLAANECDFPGVKAALDENGNLKNFPFTKREKRRIYQFDGGGRIPSYPIRPEDALNIK